MRVWCNRHRAVATVKLRNGGGRVQLQQRSSELDEVDDAAARDATRRGEDNKTNGARGDSLIWAPRSTWLRGVDASGCCCRARRTRREALQRCITIGDDKFFCNITGCSLVRKRVVPFQLVVCWPPLDTISRLDSFVRSKRATAQRTAMTWYRRGCRRTACKRLVMLQGIALFCFPCA